MCVSLFYIECEKLFLYKYRVRIVVSSWNSLDSLEMC